MSSNLTSLSRRFTCRLPLYRLSCKAVEHTMHLELQRGRYEVSMRFSVSPAGMHSCLHAVCTVGPFCFRGYLRCNSLHKPQQAASDELMLKLKLHFVPLPLFAVQGLRWVSLKKPLKSLKQPIRWSSKHAEAWLRYVLWHSQRCFSGMRGFGNGGGVINIILIILYPF